MATILACGSRNLKGQFVYDHTFARPEYKTIGQVGDTVLNHDLGVKFVIAAVTLKGQKAYYTPVEGSIETIGPDAVAEEERIGGSIPRLANDRFE